jgi:hypothetical protein
VFHSTIIDGQKGKYSFSVFILVTKAEVFYYIRQLCKGQLFRQLFRKLFRQLFRQKIQLLIINIYFIFYEFPDGFFKQSAILAFFVLLWF